MIKITKFKRVLCSVGIISLVLISGLASVILYPQPLFANKVEYKQFRIYSNYKIDVKVQSILDSTLALVSKSELFDTTYKVDIFLSFNSVFNKIDNTVFGIGPTARPVGNNIILKVDVDIRNNLVYPTFHKPCEQNFDYILAHELIHCLQTHTYGILKFNPLRYQEIWKLEGYPEYIARQKFDSSVDKLKCDIERFVELKRTQTGIWILEPEGTCEEPEYYHKGLLITEYLINVSHMTYDQVLNDPRSEDEIYLEMVDWSDRQ